MSDHEQEMSKWLTLVKREFRHFAQKYSVAVKNGARVAGKHMIDAVEEKDQSNDQVAGKLFAAVKKGLQHAGDELAATGLEYADRVKRKGRKK